MSFKYYFQEIAIMHGRNPQGELMVAYRGGGGGPRGGRRGGGGGGGGGGGALVGGQTVQMLYKLSV